MQVRCTILLKVLLVCLAVRRALAVRQKTSRDAVRTPLAHDPANVVEVDKREARPYKDRGWEEGGEGDNFIQEARLMRADFWARNFSSRVSEEFGAMQGPAILTVTMGVNDLLVNFMLNVEKASERAGKTTDVANAAHDQDSLQLCEHLRTVLQRVRLHCIDVVGWLPPSLSGNDRRSFVLWTKPVIFEEAVKSSTHGVLMSDIDVVHRKDLVGWLDAEWRASNSTNVVLMTGTEWQTCCNSGTVFGRSDRSLPFIEQWVENNDKFFNRSLGDQSALLHTIVYDAASLQISWGFNMPFPQGPQPKGPYRILPVPETVILQQCRKWDVEEPYAIHYNCVNTHVNAKHTLQSHGNWSEDVTAVQKSSQRLRMIEERDWRDPAEFGLSPDGLPTSAGENSAAPRGGVWNRERPEGTPHFADSKPLDMEASA